jgi:uncharacterized ion transporter superfamily protein YfcC
MGKFKFPSAYTILFFLIAVVAALSWIVPAGQYQMAMNATLGKEVPIAAFKNARKDFDLVRLATLRGVARSARATTVEVVL